LQVTLLMMNMMKRQNGRVKDSTKKDYSGYIGKHVDTVDFLNFPNGTRIITPSTMVTMDYCATRLNVHVDDKITSVIWD